MTAATEYASQRFTAPDERLTRMGDVVLRHVDAQRPLRVLDIGCGSGGQLLRLATLLPKAQCSGIDISPANIAMANDARGQHPAANRVRFAVGDYLATGLGPVDLIVVDSVLHLLNVPDDVLFGKIAHDLCPGGILINSMPDDRWSNVLLAIVRRFFRHVRSPAVDRFVMRVAGWLHPRTSGAFLEERLHYMYMVPERFAGGALNGVARAAGLDVIARYDVPRASVAQLLHTMTVFQARL
jgi:trans-aconitate 2-methyltransferase